MTITSTEESAPVTETPLAVPTVDPSLTAQLDATEVEPPDLPRGLPVAFAPLSVQEQREMYDAVKEIHAMMAELKKAAENLPAMLPQLLESAPPMVRMMLNGLIK